MPALERWEDQADTEAHRLERKRLSENHYLRAQAAASWLLATLVAANGGAALAVFSRAGPAPPAAAFAAGVVLAILAGFASWREAQDRASLHYVESQRREHVSGHGARMEARWRRTSRIFGIAARLANYASLAAFVGGCMTAAAPAWARPTAAVAGAADRSPDEARATGLATGGPASPPPRHPWATPGQSTTITPGSDAHRWQWSQRPSPGM